MIKNQFLQKLLYKSARSRAFFTLLGVVIQEIRISLSQFFTIKYPLRSLVRTFGVILSSLIRLLLGRNLKFTFAFAGEDRMIEGILKPNIRRLGCYVDVGSNHPIFLSNTYSLYRKGWRGICIDANRSLIKKYALLRPRDKAVVALVSNCSEYKNFTFVENDVLSTVDDHAAKQYENEGLKTSTERILSSSLTQILKENNFPTNFDLLSVDAEEHDFEVLQGLDWTKYRPSLVIVEHEEFSFVQAYDNSICRFMKEQGYRIEAYALKNLYFVPNA